ncbi:MAG: SurA N-terminal domain-containing protein [Candidatus Omnitrophota bacterium]|jgi:hypothetical protein
MKRFTFLVLAMFIFTGLGCAKKEKAAINIGDIRITAEEFNKAFEASRSVSAGVAERKEFLDTFISRKLILKEAEKLGLDKDDKFLQSIQLFWEQSLLKLILANKMKELAANIIIDEREIEDYYQMRKAENYPDKELSEVYEVIKILLYRKKQTEAVQDWAASLKNKANIEIDYKLLGLEEGK